MLEANATPLAPMAASIFLSKRAAVEGSLNGAERSNSEFNLIEGTSVSELLPDIPLGQNGVAPIEYRQTPRLIEQEWAVVGQKEAAIITEPATTASPIAFDRSHESSQDRTGSPAPDGSTAIRKVPAGQALDPSKVLTQFSEPKSNAGTEHSDGFDRIDEPTMSKRSTAGEHVGETHGVPKDAPLGDIAVKKSDRHKTNGTTTAENTPDRQLLSEVTYAPKTTSQETFQTGLQNRTREGGSALEIPDGHILTSSHLLASKESALFAEGTLSNDSMSFDTHKLTQEHYAGTAPRPTVASTDMESVSDPKFARLDETNQVGKIELLPLEVLKNIRPNSTDELPHAKSPTVERVPSAHYEIELVKLRLRTYGSGIAHSENEAFPNRTMPASLIGENEEAIQSTNGLRTQVAVGQTIEGSGSHHSSLPIDQIAKINRNNFAHTPTKSNLRTITTTSAQTSRAVEGSDAITLSALPSENNLAISSGVAQVDDDIALKVGISQGSDMPQLGRDAGLKVAAQLADGMRATNSGAIEIKLSPEELGRVKLSLSPTESGLSITIHAERPETMDLIRRHIDLLAQDLRQQGHQNLSFHFSQNSSENQRGRGNFLEDGGNFGGTEIKTEMLIAPTKPKTPVPGRLDLRL